MSEHVSEENVITADEILRPLHDGLQTVDVGDGKVIKLHPLTQSRARQIASDTEARSLVSKGKPYEVTIGDSKHQVVLHEETIALATLMENLVAEPDLTFSQWVAVSEANYPVFLKIAKAINDITMGDLERIKNVFEPQAEESVSNA